MTLFDLVRGKAMRSAVLVAGALLALTDPAAQALEKIRVGIPATGAFSFMAVDFGDHLGIFARNGVALEKVILLGSAKLHQAMTADAIDIAVGAGTDFAFLVKGAPELAVAASAGRPLDMGFVVPYDSPAKTSDDLKGKRIGISSYGALTDWLAHRLAQVKGWKPENLVEVTVGSDKAAEAAFLVTHQIDAMITGSASGLQLEETQRGRLLFPASEIVGDFLDHAIFATDNIVRKDPEAVRGFLKGWFETIAYERAHRDQTIAYAVPAMRRSAAVETKEYDLVTPMFSADGKFKPAALKVLARSFVELGQLDSEPDLTKYYTEAYLPKK
ncbi:MAG TPA: ABC transporter substrate-binding protein [Stellaceae bacterium]|nr:ABC transporter substrate-binding protein [Stellaceae bacterium]